jgi:hypothetical protein
MLVYVTPVGGRQLYAPFLVHPYRVVASQHLTDLTKTVKVVP